MFRIVAAACSICLGLFLVTGGVNSGDKEKGKDDKKIKGMLPPGWKDLMLDKDQIQKIYAIQKSFKGKLEDLEDQIVALKTMQRAEMVKVLNEEQKSLLRKLATGEDVKDKKKDDKKKPDKEKGE